MKKLIVFFMFSISVIFLGACSNQQATNQQNNSQQTEVQDSMDGEYYWISEGRNELTVTIKGDKGFVDSEGGHSFTIDKDLETFEVSGFMNPTVKYKYKDGVLTARLTGVERDYYKKGSAAYEEALKKYGYK